MKEEDIIEGPITIEEPGTFLSDLVITDKKGTDRIGVTLGCEAVNKAIYATHEPILFLHLMSSSTTWAVVTVFLLFI